MFSKLHLAKVVGLLLVIFCTAALFAQSFQATIVGQVVDASGAVVGNAKVVAKNDATGREQESVTSKEGLYSLPQLVPGTYTLTVTAQGFAPVVESGVTLVTGQTAHMDIKLQVAGHAETVEIIASAPVVNTDTSSKGEVMINKQVEDLPLNVRDFNGLTMMVGAVMTPPSKDDQAADGLSVAGSRTDSTNYTLDGVTNRSDRNGNVGVNTSIDSIREFSVSTSTYTAEFGRTAGGQITVVSKSGTNQLHGSVFEYIRNNVLDARPSFAAEDEKQLLIRNQFGASLGGPIIKNKTFFFGSYEGMREKRSTNQLTNAPVADWKNGDFRQSRGPGSDGILGTADDTGRVLLPSWNSTTNKWVRSEAPGCSAANPTACNIIPAALISPASAQILSWYPAANMGDGINYNARGIIIDNRDSYLFKIDHTFSASNNAYVRWARQKKYYYDPFPSVRNFYPNMGSDKDARNDSFAISDTQLFSGSLINEFRFGVYDQHNVTLAENRDKDWIAALGIPGLDPGAANQGSPAIRIDGFAENGDRPNYPFVYSIKNYQFYDALTWVKGRHSFKFGIDITRAKYNELDIRNIRGDFRFRGYFTNPTGKTSAGMYAFADFLLGYADATQRQIGAEPSLLRGWQHAAFVQDDWRVSNHLTLNLGLRYDLQLPMNDERGRLANFFPAEGATRSTGELLKTRYNDFSPRIGFAWRPFADDKTVVRGGGGLFYSLETFNVTRQQLALNYPWTQREEYKRSSSSPVVPTFTNPFPTGSANIAQPLGAAYENQTPTVYQYNLTFERELVKDLALEVGYMGSQARHLGRRYNINMPLPTGQVTSSESTVGGVTVTTYTPVTVRRFPSLGDVTYQEMMASSNYNALQAALRRRSRHGLTLMLNYTYSRALDDASSTNISTTGAQKVPQDIRNLRSEYGLSDFHRKHALKGAINYELPFGRKRQFLSHTNKVVEAIIGGWQVNSLFQYWSGRPFTPQFNSGGVTSQRPDLIGDPWKDIPAGSFFNPAAFRKPEASPEHPDLFGEITRNTMIGPSFANVDLSLIKSFRLNERCKMQLRAEAFNVLNHTNYFVPEFLIDDPQAGKVQSTANEARELQFALRFTF